ncbi:MAG: hypothetical protein ACLRFE_04585 [Clostridia bacterium]
MSKTFGYYLTISVKDLIASIMINEDRTEISKGELYDLYLDTMQKMKDNNIDGRVAYSRDDLNEFKQENEKYFEVGISYIKLRNGSIEWLQQHVVPYMSIDTLQILDMIPQHDEFSL